jgi:uncharacterized protein (TIGR02391 family)
MAVDNESERLTLIRQSESGPDRIDVFGVIENGEVVFSVQADVKQHDLIERPLPKLEIETYRVISVTRYDEQGHRGRVEAEIKLVKTKTISAEAGTALVGLHPRTARASGALFRNGHFGQAVFAAFRDVELRIRQTTGLDDFGVRLMNRVLDPEAPIIDLAVTSGRWGVNQREGFHAIFVGAMKAIRNPGAHGDESPRDASLAAEQLHLASLLHRLIDNAMPCDAAA